MEDRTEKPAGSGAAAEEPRQGGAAKPGADAAAQARADAEAVRLGRWLPLGMLLGAAVGLVGGAVTRKWGICVPVGIALGILLAGTVPVFLRRSR